jgi:hypothetical protein
MAEPQGHSTRAELRLLAGFAVAPPAAVLITLITYDALWYSGMLSEGVPINSLDSAASLGMGVGTLAVLTTVFGAVPVVVWLKRRRPLSLRTLLLLGAALGNLPFAIIILGIVVTHLVSGTLSSDIGRYWNGLPGAVVRTVMGLICGMGSAAVFWAVAVRGTLPKLADSTPAPR